jgi:Co/Zn/Cd efflux system component
MNNFENSSWLDKIAFLVEGVMLLTVACIGLVGNILSFIVLNKQRLQKTFHKLLLLLNIFDMVSSRLWMFLND